MHDAPAEKGRRILVVDDEKNVRFTVTHALRSDGYAVDSAASGVEGLERAGAERYDLLLVDLRMPGMTGIEMLRELRLRDPRMPAVIITAYGVPQQLVEAAGLGAIDCIHKPFSIQTIRAVVREVLDRSDGYLDEAVDASDAAATDGASDSSAEALLRRAKQAVMRREPASAHDPLERAIAIDPQCSEAYMLDGIVSLLEGDGQAARERFRTALQIDPTNKNASEYLAFYGR